MDFNLQMLRQGGSSYSVGRLLQRHFETELEDELRSQGWTDRLFVHTWSQEELMMVINKERASTVYPHEECSDECKKRGIILCML